MVLERVENGLPCVNYLHSSGEFHWNGTISCYRLGSISHLLDQEKGVEKEQALDRMLMGYWVDLEGTRHSHQTSWPTGHPQEVKEYATMDRLFFPYPLGIDCGPCYPMKTNIILVGWAANTSES